MKRILLTTAIAVLILVACNEMGNRQVPKFAPGDLVKTKFGETVLIIDTQATSCGCSVFKGTYTVKRKGASENELMKSAELSDISEATTLE